MARAIERIERDIQALEEAIRAIAKELHNAYANYLTTLGKTVQQQLNQATYHLCTQGYPESFLSLSLNQRQQLQQSVRKFGQQTAEQLQALMKSEQQEASLEQKNEEEREDEDNEPDEDDEKQGENKKDGEDGTKEEVTSVEASKQESDKGENSSLFVSPPCPLARLYPPSFPCRRDRQYPYLHFPTPRIPSKYSNGSMAWKEQCKIS